MGLLRWFRRRSAPAVDAWAPRLGVGEWRTIYAECCDAVLAYHRVVATLDSGPIRERLGDLAQQLPPLLAVAERLATIAEEISPSTPRRTAALRTIGLDPTPAEQVMEHLNGLRDALWGLADDAARVSLRLRNNPAATDLQAILSSLGAGLAEARRHGWTPIGHRPEPP
jgi:hypothetical protein